MSTTEQANEGVSLSAQRKRVEAYCDLYDLDLVGIYSDAGASAKSLDREGMQAALATLREGEAQGIVVAKLDRLTRSIVDMDLLIRMYFGDGAKYEATLLSVTDHIDTSTAAGRLVLNVLLSVSQWEREAIGERTKEALAHLKAQGVKLGGVPLGATRTDERDDNGHLVLVQVESELETVHRVHALRDRGLTLRAIANTLTREGHRTKRGGNWYAATVKAILDRGPLHG